MSHTHTLPFSAESSGLFSFRTDTSSYARLDVGTYAAITPSHCSHRRPELPDRSQNPFHRPHGFCGVPKPIISTWSCFAIFSGSVVSRSDLGYWVRRAAGSVGHVVGAVHVTVYDAKLHREAICADTMPNRNSRHAILLREGSKIVKHAVAIMADWSKQIVDAIGLALRRGALARWTRCLPLSGRCPMGMARRLWA